MRKIVLQVIQSFQLEMSITLEAELPSVPADWRLGFESRLTQRNNVWVRVRAESAESAATGAAKLLMVNSVLGAS